jgi:glycosyl transferase family 25
MNVMIRVVSLSNAAERRSLFIDMAKDTTLSWAFLDAHVSAAEYLTNDPNEQIRMVRRQLQPAEVGCYSSHVDIWRMFLKSEHDLLFVFEDDVVIDWRYIEFLASHDFDTIGFHYIKLFNKVPARQRLVRSPFLSTYYHLVQNKTPSLGTQAYLLTRKAAQILFAHCRVIRRPLDQELDRGWAHGIPSLSIVPSPAFERFTPSTIGEKRFIKRRRLERMRPRTLFENARRIAYNLITAPGHPS